MFILLNFEREENIVGLGGGLMKKVIFFDIDGTLIDSHNGKKDISSRVKQSLRDLQRRGHYVFIATGRPYAFLSKVIREFGFDGYVLANGAHVIVDGKKIHSKAIDNGILKNLVSHLENKNLEFVLEDETCVYAYENYEKIWPFYEQYGILKDYFMLDYEVDQVNAFKIEVLCPKPEDLEYCIEFLKNHEEYTYCHSVHPTHLEIYLKENHKATGILKVLDYLNISIENTYAFGDGSNDIEMLETVGCGIAMGNASDEVKKYANVVTDIVANDGIVSGVEKYILS